MTGKEWVKKLPEKMQNNLYQKIRRRMGKKHLALFRARESSPLWECLCSAFLMRAEEITYWKGVADEYDK